MVREGCGLVHQVAGDQDRTPLCREPAQQRADPDDALRVEAVGRLVQQDHLGVAEERGGDAEALAHAEGVRPHPAPGHRGESRLLQDAVDAAQRDAVARRQGPQMIARGAGSVRRPRVQQGAHPAQGLAEFGVGATAEGGGAGGRPVQAQDEPHGGGLSGAVGAEEAGDAPGADAEGEVVHGPPGAVLLREVLYVDAGHGISLAGCAARLLPRGWRSSPPCGGGQLSVPPATMCPWSASCARCFAVRHTRDCCICGFPC